MASKNGTILNLPKDTPRRADTSMSAPNLNKKSSQVVERQRFREAFKSCLEENRISPDRSRYYVQWAKEFVEFLPEKRLKARSAEDIRAFLASLSQREGMAGWKVRQAEYSLRVLYEIFLPGYSPEKHASAEPSMPPPAPNGKAKTAGFRDRVLPGEVERRFAAAVERFRTELRTRHYSYRTETFYLEWMRRSIWPAFARKYPNAGKEWIWQYVFPARSMAVDPRSGKARRHHLDENSVQKAVKKAALEAGINKRVGCHTLRHSLPICWRPITTSERSRNSLDMPMSLTMIYTHVLNRPGLSVKSPADS